MKRLVDRLSPRAAPLLTALRSTAHSVAHPASLVIPAITVSALALLITALPLFSNPFVHLLALTGMILGALAWVRRENRVLAAAAVAVAGLALVWRYLFLAVLLIVGAAAYTWWKSRRPRTPVRAARLRKAQAAGSSSQRTR